MALLSESPTVLPIHRKILAFSFIGWIFDFYDLPAPELFVSSTHAASRIWRCRRSGCRVLLGTALAFTAVGGFIGGALADRYGRKPLLMVTILVYSVGTLLSGLSTRHVDAVDRARDHRHRRRRRVGGGARAGRRDRAAARARALRLVPAERLGVRALLRVDGRQPPGAVDRLARRVHAVRRCRRCIVVFIRRQMPESDVWLLSVKAGVSKRLGYVAALGADARARRCGRRRRWRLTVTTFNMAAYWFKTIWLPTYLHRDARPVARRDVAWLLLMDQIGSLVRLRRVRLRQRLASAAAPASRRFRSSRPSALAMITLGWTCRRRLHG